MGYKSKHESLALDIETQTLRHELFRIGRKLGIDDDEIEEKCSDIMNYAMMCASLRCVEQSINERALYRSRQFPASCGSVYDPLTSQYSSCLSSDCLPSFFNSAYDPSDGYSYDTEKLMCLLRAVAVASKDVSISKLDTLIFAAEKKQLALKRCPPVKTHFIPHVPYVPESWGVRYKKMKVLSSTDPDKIKYLFGLKQSIGSSERSLTAHYPAKSKGPGDHMASGVSEFHQKRVPRSSSPGQKYTDGSPSIRGESLNHVLASSRGFDRAICSIIDSLSIKRGREKSLEVILWRKVLESGLSIDQASSIINESKFLARVHIQDGCFWLSNELGGDYGRYPLSRPALFTMPFPEIVSRDIYSPLHCYRDHQSIYKTHIRKRMHTIHTIHPLLWQSCYNCKFLESTTQVFMNQCVELHRYIWYLP